MPGGQGAPTAASKSASKKPASQDEEDEEGEDAAEQEKKDTEIDSKLDRLTLLHSGDIVLVRCKLQGGGGLIALSGDEQSGGAECGYLCTTGDGIGLRALPVEGSFGDTGYDVRDFLFVVVQQLSYHAQKDLRRRRKYVEAELSGRSSSAGSSAMMAELREYEKRAQFEAKQNEEVIHRRSSGVLEFGSVFQLQHLRSKKFVGIRPKFPAKLNKVARRVELQAGSINCWIRANPAFVHKMQGEPVLFDEELHLECTKLGSDWNYSCARCHTKQRDVVHEISCLKGDTAFFFLLYNRTLKVDIGSPLPALGFGSVIRLFNPEQNGFVTASCNRSKLAPFIRNVPLVAHQHSFRFCAKDLWVTELLSVDRASMDVGVEFGQTPVLLRHYGSGRYLSVDSDELMDHGMLQEEDDLASCLPSPTSAKLRGPSSSNRRSSVVGVAATPQGSPTEQFSATLTPTPGPTCIFMLEPTSVMRAENPSVKLLVPRNNAKVFIKWFGGPDGATPLWLSVTGQKKGERGSLALHWTHERYSKDAMQIQLLDEHEELWECDAIAVRRQLIQDQIIPKIRSADGGGIETMSQIDQAITDMIHFLADSHHWGAEEKKTNIEASLDKRKRDPLKAAWTASPQRQRFVRELKYVDMTVHLFEELALKAPDLVEGEVGYSKRVDQLEQSGGITAEEGVNPETLKKATARCLKLIVRLWLHAFLGSRENEDYFHRNGWMDVIDKLNGQGMGASDVFVALVGNNPALVRCISSGTVDRFIAFIRLLGPLDTWLSFFKVICAPQGQAVPLRQQDLLKKIIFRGHRSSDAERNATLANRRELLVWVRLDEPIGVPLGRPTSGQSSPWRGCLAQGLLSRGVHDIAISWAHPDRWEIGQGVLYHGPRALGLPRLSGAGGRSWTSLARVVWVLQPERCCEASIGRRWADVLAEEDVNRSETPVARMSSKQAVGVSSGTGTQYELLRMLANYIRAQLELIANIVRARQMNCIMALQEEYSFSLCICGISDRRLPTSIRGSFCDILVHLWLDRHPHTELVVPNLLRRWDPDNKKSREDDPASWRVLSDSEVPEAWSEDHLRSLPEEVHCFYRFDPPAKMEALTQVLRTFLCAGPETEQQVHTATADNAMMLSIMNCVGQMLRFGYFHSKEMLSEFLGPILRCLDGRTDWIDAEDAGGDAAARQLSLEEAEEAAGAGGLNEITPLLQKAQSRTASRPSQGGSGLPPAPEGKFVRARFPPTRSTLLRYHSNDTNNGVVAAKRQMLHVLLHMMRSALDFKVSRALRAFPWRGDPTAAFVDVVLQVSDDPALALEQARVTSPNVMLADLLMYEDPALFDLALELLFVNCMRTTDFLDSLSRVKLLRPEHADLSLELRKEVSTLGKLIYSFENWGVDDDFSTVDEEPFQQLQQIVKHMRQVCSVGKGSSSSSEVQDMLRQTEFFTHVAFVLQTEPEDYGQGSRDLLMRMVGTICFAATHAIRGNPTNQDLMFKQLTPAADLMDDIHEAAVLLTEIFRGNLELCNRVPEELVIHFGDLVVRERRAGRYRPWYLGFFCAIVSVGTAPVPRNQRLVVDVINTQKPSMVLRLGEVTAHRLGSLASAFRSEGQLVEPDPSTWSMADGELIYYLRSLELMVGLARGQGSEALTNKPWVNSLFPAIEAIRLLLQIHHPAGSNGVSVHCRLRTKWLQLLHVMVYDVEASLFDEELLGSPVHVEFFGQMLRWIDEALDLVPLEDVAPDQQQLDEGSDEYIMSLLRCIDAFFQSAFPMLPQSELCGSLMQVVMDTPRHFSRIVQQGPGQLAPRRGLRDPGFLHSIALRILSATGGRKGKHLVAVLPGSDGSEVRGRRFSITNADAQRQWDHTIGSLGSSAKVTTRQEQEQEELGQVFVNIADLTDPEAPRYVKSVPSDMSGTLPPDMDFRRNRISVEDMLRRFVKHSREFEFGGYQTLRRMLRTFLAMIRVARAKSDPKAAQTLQMQFVQTGVAELVIQVLDANIAEDIEAMSWELLAETLHASKHCTRSLQSGLYAAMRGMDDSGLWESFQELTDAVAGSAKTCRTMQRLPALLPDERRRLEKYKAQLGDTCTALRVLRLMVEGHYVEMQDYLFTQVGNMRSTNVLATAFVLMTRLCKDPTDADMADELEFECLSLLLELLTEVSQGPNLRNQEFLSTLGLVEAVFKVLAAGCVQLQRADRDLYPPSVQRLKAQLVETLLALLESRADTTIHQTMVQRVDRQVLRERIQFVYLYFVFGIVGIAKGEVSSDRHAAIPMDGRTQRLFLPTIDISELHEEVVTASAVAEELVEDLDDEELDVLFSEGFDCLQVCLELSPHSRQFEAQVMPKPEDEPFVDSPSAFPTKADYLRERRAFHERDVYRRSFDFLKRFVRTIEINLMGDQLQSLHFQQPLTAMWYCTNSAKEKILATVPLSSVDVKTKAFLQMCKEVHMECKLIRQLSRFSILPDRYQRWAQRNLPDGLHRPFQVFLADDARLMQHLLVMALILSVILAAHVGTNLTTSQKGGKDDEDEPKPHTRWSSEASSIAAEVLGGLYFAVTLLWVFLTMCLKVPQSAKIHMKQSSCIKSWVLAFFSFFREPLQLWRSCLLLWCGLALFADHNWLYSFLVADCFCQNAKLATVLAGMWAPAPAWSMTFIGMVLVTFAYASIGFHFYSDEFGAYCDTNMALCTANILYQGTRSGVIGLSSMMEPITSSDTGWGMRIVYDVSYFIIFGIMLLNAVVALVVDSFSRQRREAEEREKQLSSETFISGLDRKVIDAAAQTAGIKHGFDFHEEVRQNKWDYMSFIFHLQEKQQEDYTGPEQQIWKLLADNDVKWLPLGTSKILQGEFTDNDGLSRIQRQMNSVDKQLRSMNRQRKALFATLGAMSRTFIDKAANLDQEAKSVRMAVIEASSRPNIQALARDMTRYKSVKSVTSSGMGAGAPPA